MPRLRRVPLATAAVLVGLGACGEPERQPPPPSAAPMPPPQAAESLLPPVDTLHGDSVMARDTARIPE